MRKVLSFVLVLALVLGSFSFAFGLTDIDNSPNKVAIEVNNDLGIITGYTDGTFQGEKAVNRAEFAAMITRAMGIPESALVGFSETSFKDVAGYGWAVQYLAFCESKGIMLGDGKGNVMPGRTISVNEAVTMALRAVGYVDNSAKLVGTWPSNYVTLGKQEGLYTDLAEAVTIDRENAAQVIYNALTVQLVAVNADGETTPLYEDTGKTIEKNMLTAYLGATDKGKVVLGNKYDVDSSLINVYKNLGAYGTAYENSDGDLIAFKIDSTALTGKIDGEKFVVGDTKYDLTNATGNAFEFDNADKAAATVNFITAASTAAKAALITGVAGASSDDGETVTLHADVSGKYIYEVYSVVAWKADFAELADSDVQEDIDDGVLLGQDFALDSKDNIKDNGFVLKGVASLADIDEDNVVAVYTDGTEIRMVTVGTKTVKGTITELGADFAVIDKTEYSVSNLTGAIAFNKLALDDEGTFSLDYEGNIYDADVTAAPDTFGLILDYSSTAGTWSDEDLAKIFTQNETVKTYGFAKDFDEVVTVTNAFVTYAATGYGIVTAPALVSYALNDDGELKVVEAKAATATAFSVTTNKVAKIDGANRTIAADVVVFVSDGAETNGYRIAAIGDVEKAKNLKGVAGFVQFVLDSNNKVVAMLVDDTDLDAGTGDEFYGVVNQATKLTDDVLKLVGFVDGKAKTLTSVKDYALAKTPGTVDGERDGALFIYTPDATGNVKSYVPTDGGTTVDNAIIDGIVTVSAVSSDGTVITMFGGTKFTASEDAVVYKYNATDKKYTVAKLKDIKKNSIVIVAFDTDNGGDNEDRVADIIIFK